jgi:hypothetical protein
MPHVTPACDRAVRVYILADLLPLWAFAAALCNGLVGPISEALASKHLSFIFRIPGRSSLSSTARHRPAPYDAAVNVRFKLGLNALT